MECKCPFRIRHEVPPFSNFDYIVLNDSDCVELKKNHHYYEQIQGQMAITSTKWSDLFIFTYAVDLTIRVHFDERYWSDLVSNLDYFFKTYLADDLLVNFTF